MEDKPPKGATPIEKTTEAKRDDGTTVVNHYHKGFWNGLATFLIGLAVFACAIVLSINGIEKINENRDVYRQCAWTCGDKHFMGTQLGEDVTRLTATANEGQSRVAIISKDVIEFDRTPCMRDCNTMYLALRNRIPLK